MTSDEGHGGFTPRERDSGTRLPVTEGSTVEELYLDLLKRYLTRYGAGETWRRLRPHKGTAAWLVGEPVQRLLGKLGYALCRRVVPSPEALNTNAARVRAAPDADTLLGLKKLDHLQFCVTDVLSRGVAGDLIETGVWRGGASIFMRGVLKAYGDTKRTVWVADSFQGPPKAATEMDRSAARLGRKWSTYTYLAVPLHEVQRNFARYGLLDEQVRFLPGWFRDTLPGAPFDRLAVMRLDGDMYESTMDAMHHLYPKLAVGGYVIIDDYSVPECRAAVHDYRHQHGVTEVIEPVDRQASFWRRVG